MVDELTSANFMPMVLAADGKAMVEFYATWCPHCKRMEPLVEELAEDGNCNAAVYRIDVDKEPDLANAYAPEGFPTFVVFEAGEVVRSATGEQTSDYLRSMLDF